MAVTIVNLRMDRSRVGNHRGRLTMGSVENSLPGLRGRFVAARISLTSAYLSTLKPSVGPRGSLVMRRLTLLVASSFSSSAALAFAADWASTSRCVTPNGPDMAMKSLILLLLRSCGRTWFSLLRFRLD